MVSETILWRRLDSPGHDACRLVDQGEGSRIEGVSVFQHETGAAALVYEVEYDRDWQTREGAVKGWVGSCHIDIGITRSAVGLWTMNGQIMPHLHCVDLDFGFTPATNLSQLRRIALEIGQSADVPVAWLDVPYGSLEVLQQRYERCAVDTYWYTAPRFDYAATLQVNAIGFVEIYPGLWEVESQEIASR